MAAGLRGGGLGIHAEPYRDPARGGSGFSPLLIQIIPNRRPERVA